MASCVQPVLGPSPAGVDRPPGLVELKNGKIVFKQKALALEKLSETMKEIVDFREMLHKAAQPLVELPSQHLSLISKLVHESDKTLSSLSKSIRQQLVPDDIDLLKGAPQVDGLSISAIEKSIVAVADRVNYGADPLLAEGRGPKLPPASLCLWRWEVKDYSVLPKSIREKAETRRAERLAAKSDLTRILNNLPAEQRAHLFGLKQENGVGGSTANHPALVFTQEQAAGKENEPLPVEKRGPGRPPKDSTVKPEVSEKQVKAQEATKKSAAVFAKFFTSKTKATKPVEPQSAGEEVKKNVQVAPVNFFNQRRKDLIFIDRGESSSSSHNASIQDIVEELLESLPSPYRCRRNVKPVNGLKTSSPYSVRQILAVLSDAEIRGDELEVARLTRLLKDRSKIPVKIISFADNNRPGYLGTWTRQSSFIGPRAPLGKDVVALDYSCDSGEEWEEEEDGEDVISSAGSKREDDDMSDGDSLDGWLVGDEEDVGGEPCDLSELDELGFENKSLKRKIPPEAEPIASSTVPQKEKRRKLVVPLVPFIKGPSWETTMGQTPIWEGFQSLRIQLFNDAQYPIDPFTYTSTVVTEKSVNRSAATTSTALPVGGFKAPSIAPSSSAKVGPLPPPPPPLVVAATSNAAKANFPESLLPALEEAIKSCKTGSLNVLVDNVFQRFKQDYGSMKVKKYTIESKVKEIAQKGVDPEAPAVGKIWRLGKSSA